MYKILYNELGLSKLSAPWVPKMLSNYHKTRRTEISKNNLDRMNSDPENIFNRIVTQDETWVHHFDPELKTHSMEWRKKGSPPPRKFKVTKRRSKVMVSIFWDCQGIIMIDYLEKQKTINGQYYADTLVRLRECIKKKRLGKLRKSVLLLQDNAPSHTELVAQNAAQNCGFEILDHRS